MTHGLTHDVLTLLTALGLLAALGCSGPPKNLESPRGEIARVVEPVPDPGPAPPLETTDLIHVPGGIHRPLYPGKDEPAEFPVATFLLERHAVTNGQFLAFVWSHPEWRRSRIRGLFADGSYLQHWDGDLSFQAEYRDAPVTNVSWFAARAYAESIDRRLPNLAEWEYVAAASETAARGRDEDGYNQRILTWYSRPTPAVLPAVGQQAPNFFGVRDLHGLIWEWVDDFNTALVTGESRGDSGLDRNLFCGSGSIGSADPQDYAAFMRFAFRSSLEARYSVNNLGFRCAASAPESS